MVFWTQTGHYLIKCISMKDFLRFALIIHEFFILCLILFALINNPRIDIIIELAHSKTILENTVEIEPQPVPLDFKNLSQYSSHSK